MITKRIPLALLSIFFSMVAFASEPAMGSDATGLIICIAVVLLLLCITVGSYVLVAMMAQKRNRSVVGWVLLSLLASPLLMIIILLCIGKNKNGTGQDF